MTARPGNPVRVFYVGVEVHAEMSVSMKWFVHARSLSCRKQEGIGREREGISNPATNYDLGGTRSCQWCRGDKIDVNADGSTKCRTNK